MSQFRRVSFSQTTYIRPGSPISRLQDYLADVWPWQALLTTCLAPLERYALIRQGESALNIGSRPPTSSLLAYLRRIVQHQGLFSLFRGNFSSLIGLALQQIPQAVFFRNIQQYFAVEGELTKPMNLANLCAAVLVSSFAGSILTYPFETVRVRLALSYHRKATAQDFKGVFDCMVKTSKRKNFRALYSGFSLGILSSCLKFTGILCATEVELGELELAAAVACISAYPIDTIRRKLQVNDLGRTVRYSNGKEVFRSIMSAQGFAGLYSGLLPWTLNTIAAVGLGRLIVENRGDILAKMRGQM